jgi:hypothetical protein
MASVSSLIEMDIKQEKEFNYSNFYFYYFNGKSLQGEVWMYLRGQTGIYQFFNSTQFNELTTGLFR